MDIVECASPYDAAEITSPISSRVPKLSYLRRAVPKM